MQITGIWNQSTTWHLGFIWYIHKCVNMPFSPQWLKLSHFSECCTGHQTAPAEWQYQSVNHRLPTCHALAHAANSEIRHKPNNKPQIKVPAILLFDLSFSKKNLYFYRWKIGCNLIGTVQGLWAVMLASQLIFFLWSDQSLCLFLDGRVHCVFQTEVL